MATETAEPAVEPIPQVPRAPGGTRVGAKFGDILDKINKGEEVAAEPKPEPTPEPKPEPAPEPEPKPEPKPAAKKSPLDAVLETSKKEEPSEDDKILQQSLDEKKADWQLARKQIDIYKKQTASLNGEIAKLREAPKPDLSEIESLRTERQNLQTKIEEQERAIKAINAQYSDEYIALHTERNKELQKIQSRVNSFGGDANALMEALQLPEGKIKTAQIREALANIEPDDRPRIYNLIENLDSIDEKIIEFNSDLPAKWDEIKARRDAAERDQYEQSSKMIETNFNKVLDQVKLNTPTLREVSEDVEGAPAWNTSIKSASERALKVLLPGSTFEHSAAVALKGEHYDDLLKMYVESHQENLDWRKRFSEHEAASPDTKGGTPPTPQGKQKRSFAEILAEVNAKGEE